MSSMAIDFAADGEEVAVSPEENDDVLLASNDPARFNALAAAVTEDEVVDFQITGPPDGRVTLIGGYIDPSGVRVIDAEVKELTGGDEEAIARALATKDLARYHDTIVRVGTVRLGEIEDPRELTKALDTLLIGDRDLLIMQIRRNTFGDEMRLTLICPWCDHEFDVDYSFSRDVPLRGINVDGLGDPSQRLFDVELPSSGSVAGIRLVDGIAQKKVFTPENLQKTGEELNTAMLSELVATIDERPVAGLAFVRNMKARDRKRLLEFVNDTQPGPQYAEVTQDCTACDRTFPLPVTVQDMFRGD